MSFLSREEFKLLANADLDKLYAYLTDKFNALEVKIEKQTQVIQDQESRIKELEARLNQNSKNSHKQLPVIYLRKRETVRHPAGKVASRQVMREVI